MKKILSYLKNTLGPLYPVFAVAVLNLALLSLFRIGLALWKFERVCATDGWAVLLAQGVRVDFASMGWLLLVPAVLSALLLAENPVGEIWEKILRIWLTAGTVFFLFMELATPAFLATYDFRPNRLFFEYLSTPGDVFEMILKGHAVEFFASILITAAAAVGVWKFTGAVSRNLVFPRNWYVRPIYAVAAAAILFLGARSTLRHRPLNPSMVAFSSDAMVNSLAVNSGYSVLHAASQLKHEAKSAEIYGKMEFAEVLARLKKMRARPESDYLAPEVSTYTRNRASVRTGAPKNIVIILMESQGAQFIGTLGGRPLSPCLDKLAEHGWFFENCYATGTRSVRGIEAVVTGFTPTPVRAVVKLGKSQSGFFTLASLLAGKGYHTAFIYGGEKHFDNMASFFYGNGFREIIDENDYPNPMFTGSWGVSDEDLFAMADQKFRRWHAEKTPFFSLVFTSSHHDPFEFPDGKISLFDPEKQTRNNAAKYADYALGKFFESAMASDYWKDTVFLVVADHDSRAEGSELVPLKNFHIPALILGGKDVPVSRDSGLISQIDLPPTLLSLAGIDAEYPMIGFDLTRERPQRAMMIFDRNFAFMRGNEVAILQPGKPAEGFTYDFSQKTLSLTREPVPEEFARDALAAVLFGSYAYNHGLYRNEFLPSASGRQADEVSENKNSAPES